MKVTRWYPASIKPVYVGWYECDYMVSSTVMRYWDGGKWKINPDASHDCAFGTWRGDKWRGLTEKAK